MGARQVLTVSHDPVFLVTDKGWNEARPYPVRGHKPHFEKPKADDPDNGTFDEKRRGKFPVGIAVEVPLPASWLDSSVAAASHREDSGHGEVEGRTGTPPYAPRTVRLAVIGQGDVFVGSEFSPAKEQLFLQTANWLLGREDSLPRDDAPWSYPRVNLVPGSQEEQLWQWGTRLGMPVLFAYLGLVVLLVRRLR
jgi:hypothetical protein